MIRKTKQQMQKKRDLPLIKFCSGIKKPLSLRPNVSLWNMLLKKSHVGHRVEWR